MPDLFTPLLFTSHMYIYPHLYKHMQYAVEMKMVIYFSFFSVLIVIVLYLYFPQLNTQYIV